MPVPATINDLSTTAGSNYPAGTESPTTIDDYFRSHASFIAQLRDGKVATTGNETIAGVKTFSSTIVGNISGSAASATTATTATTATSATTATNLSGGAAGALPYQSGAGATALLAAGTSGQVLQSNGAGAPAWVNQSALSVGSASSAGNVTGVVAVGNGGTGQTTAAGAFSALKQDATTSATGVVELATDAEVQAGTDTVRAITPSGLFSIFTRSIGSNGYMRLPGGLLIQWGAGTSQSGTDASSNSQTITFPTAFTNVYSVIVTTNCETNTNLDVMYQVHSVTTTTFKAFANALNASTGNSGTGTATPYWIAIGN